MAERVRAMTVPGLEGRTHHFSAGLAARAPTNPPPRSSAAPTSALYQAKETGRNRIVLA
jgi:PleD family two-component response regulator